MRWIYLIVLDIDMFKLHNVSEAEFASIIRCIIAKLYINVRLLCRSNLPKYASGDVVRVICLMSIKFSLAEGSVTDKTWILDWLLDLHSLEAVS
jgi:hypothetical protein